jgi:hypothetical protein
MEHFTYHAVNAHCNIWNTSEINMSRGKEDATKEDFIKNILIVIN